METAALPKARSRKMTAQPPNLVNDLRAFIWLPVQQSTALQGNTAAAASLCAMLGSPARERLAGSDPVRNAIQANTKAQDAHARLARSPVLCIVVS
jgi:hypothetical protein